METANDVATARRDILQKISEIEATLHSLSALQFRAEKNRIYDLHRNDRVKANAEWQKKRYEMHSHRESLLADKARLSAQALRLRSVYQDRLAEELSSKASFGEGWKSRLIVLMENLLHEISRLHQVLGRLETRVGIDSSVDGDDIEGSGG